jgi:hypothetical protein
LAGAEHYVALSVVGAGLAQGATYVRRRLRRSWHDVAAAVAPVTVGALLFGSLEIVGPEE